MNWYDSRESVGRLAEWMWSTGRFNGVAEIFFMVRNPEKYTEHWRDYVSHLRTERATRRLQPDIVLACGE